MEVEMKEMGSDPHQQQHDRSKTHKIELLPPPGQHILLEFNDINLSVTKTVGLPCRKKGTNVKHILRNITGSVAPGEFCALLGPSGAGKTSLLNLLAGRVKNFKGEILVNGKPKDQLFRRYTSFVMQEDIFFGHMTVRQTLTLTSRFVSPTKLTTKEKLQRAENLIDQLKIRKCADTIVGDKLMRGISGGERKRLNIANEMLSNTPLVLMDEPTSGLDASTALGVVTMLSLLAKNGRTVIATLHQPSSHMFSLFDKAIILADGRMVFHGPMNCAVPYFTHIGYKCPVTYNPLDFILELVDEHVDEDDPMEVREDILAKYDPKKIEELAGGKKEYTVPPPLRMIEKAKYRTNWFMQYYLLFLRNIKRSALAFIPTSIIFGIITFLSCIVWWRRGYEIVDIADRRGLIFFLLLHWFIFPMFGEIKNFVTEKTVFIKERAGKQYRVSAYFISRFTSSLPLDIINPICYSTIIYWCCNLNDKFERYIWFTMLTILTYICGQALGLCLATSSDTIEGASTVAMFVFFLSTLIAGFYSRTDEIPVWFEWTKYCTPVRYIFDAFLVNEFEGTEFTGPEGVITGEQIIDESGAVFKDEIYASVLVVIAWTVGCQILAYCFLYYKTRSRR